MSRRAMSGSIAVRERTGAAESGAAAFHPRGDRRGEVSVFAAPNVRHDAIAARRAFQALTAASPHRASRVSPISSSATSASGWDRRRTRRHQSHMLSTRLWSLAIRTKLPRIDIQLIRQPGHRHQRRRQPCPVHTPTTARCTTPPPAQDGPPPPSRPASARSISTSRHARPGRRDALGYHQRHDHQDRHTGHSHLEPLRRRTVTARTDTPTRDC